MCVCVCVCVCGYITEKIAVVLPPTSNLKISFSEEDMLFTAGDVRMNS